jgi:hypothetical protein
MGHKRLVNRRHSLGVIHRPNQAIEPNEKWKLVLRLGYR